MRLQAHEPVQSRTLEKRDTTTLMYKNIRDIRSSIIKGTNYEIGKKYDLMGVELVFCSVCNVKKSPFESSESAEFA